MHITRALAGHDAPYVVAMESPQLAHALPRVEPIEHSVSLCGEPAEILIAVPDLRWQEISAEFRCRSCNEQVVAIP